MYVCIYIYIYTYIYVHTGVFAGYPANMGCTFPQWLLLRSTYMINEDFP